MERDPSTHPNNSNGDISFADKESQEAWELTEKVRDLVKAIPEPKFAPHVCVSFDEENKSRGLRVVFTAGMAVGTGHEGALLVPQKTVLILDELGIPYQIVSNGSATP